MLALTARFRTETCPYCFEQFKLTETPFRCSSPPARCKPQPDPVRESEWDDSALLGRVLKVGSGFHRELRCDACGQTSRKRLCPHCHMELPYTMGHSRNLIFAVIGAKEAGKSHYLAVLIQQLRKEVGPDLDMLLEPLDDGTIRRYRSDFYEPVYEQGQTIRGTISALADRGVQMPLVYALTFSRTRFGRRYISASVTLVFFDTAGEDLNDSDVMNTVNKYIYRSDGVILLLDPLQLPRVRDRLDGSVPLPARNTETAEILVRTTGLILNGRKHSPDSMLSTPIAVAFSKFDAVRDLVDPQFQLLSDSDHREGYDIQDFEAVNSEMQALLQDWSDQPIVHQVRTHYKNFGFFGLSALGCNPHGDQRIPRVLPRRVEDPFLWLLHQKGLIPARSRS